MSAPRLAFAGLSGGYGTTQVVRDVSGEAGPGEVLCLVGRNGVGKTTLLKLLFGYLPCWQGTVRLDGRLLGSLAPPERHRLGITYCAQERPVFDGLSVRDNLTMMRAADDLAAFAPYFARFPILERRLDQPAGTLSGGEKKILSFVRGLAEDCALVLLDEPTEGVQWENILHMAEVIAARRAAGTTFVVVEQNLAFAERVANRYLVLDQGRAVLSGLRADIAREALLAHLHV